MSKNSKNGNSKQKQQQPVCIFCQQTPLTKEHLWPDWIKNVLEKDDSIKHERYLIETTFLPKDLIQVTPNVIKKNGNILNRTLKIVCEDCNNKWMSQIEDKAKPVLEALIFNKPIQLDRKQQKLIVQWAVLRTIISEFTDENNKAITAKERREFYQTKEILENWYVWIAKREPYPETQPLSKRQPVYHHIGIQGAYRQADGSYKMPGDNHNTQSSYFEMGELIIYTFSWPETRLIYKFISAWGSKMIRLHPREYYKISWIDIPFMTIAETQELRQNIRMLDRQVRFLAGR